MEAGWPSRSASRRHLSMILHPHVQHHHHHDCQQQQQQPVQAPTLRLFQVLAPALAGRAVLFGNKLDLKSNWKCVDLPYFAAPGD